MKEYTKQKRQRALREILGHERIGDQVDLRAALKKKGVQTTQATISRDLREMGVAKVPVAQGTYAYRAEAAAAPAPAGPNLNTLFRAVVTEIKGTSHLVLVKTIPGNANGVAIQIDALKEPAILGTVAGDDTILVVVDTDAHRKAIERGFRARLGAY